LLHQKVEDGPVSPRGSATLVTVQLSQLWQHSPDGFSRSVRPVWRHCRNPRWIEGLERRGAFDQGNLGLPHPREIKLSLRDRAGALELHGILRFAGDLADELVQLFGKYRG
jgi:hypothetical protein